MPESTLTPAPVNSTTFPGERKFAMRSTAAAGEIGLLDTAVTTCGMVGTDTRMRQENYNIIVQVTTCSGCTQLLSSQM